MKFRLTGLIEFGKRDWNCWIFQLMYPTISYSSHNGFAVASDLITFRINPANKAFGLVVLGFGFGFQKAKSNPLSINPDFIKESGE
jgi:hypothetical protein